MSPHACRHCGGPLQLTQSRGIVVCRYCGTTNDTRVPVVQAAPPPPHGLQLPRRPQFVPPPVVAKPQGGQIARVIMGLGVSFGMTVVAAVLFLMPGTATLSVPAGLPAVIESSARSDYWGTGNTCLVDADGDAVLDVAGLSGPASSRFTPTIVNGSTGEVSWRGQSGDEKTKVLCAGRGHFLVTSSDFSARLITARSPSGERVVQLRDEAMASAVGNGCVTVRTSDGASVGIQLATGTTGACQASAERSRGEPGLIGLTEKRTEISAGARRYVLEKRPTGTPVLTLSAFEGSRQLWQQETRYRAATFGSAVAAAGATVMVFGASMADDKKGMVIGFDAATGAERYATRLEGMSTWNVNTFQFNGQYLITSYFTGLYAFNPVNGKLAWKIGG